METKLCKHCQTEIPKKAKVCPNCKKKQGGIVKWIVIAIVAILIIGSMGGTDEGAEKDNSVDATGLAENNVSNNTDEVASGDEQDSAIEAGESFEANGLKVTINEVSTNYTDYDDPYNWYTPDDGYKYIMVSFTYENTGDSDAYVSIYDYDCYADGTLCEQQYFDSDFINANISSGRNVSFETYYIVPVNATEVELEYTSNIWTSEKVIVKIQ